MDYLRRDSYPTGVAYENFDLERVLHTLRKTQKTWFRQREDLAVHEKGIDAIESFRSARFLMHAQVYYHHTNVAANGMLQRAIEVAIRDGVVDAEKLRNGKDDFLEHYLALDDARLLAQVLTRPESTAADLVGKLERRDLFKRGYESNVSQEEDYIVADLVKIENSLFKSASPLLEEDKFLFLIERKDGAVTEVDSFSTLTYNGEPRTSFYLFCPEEHRQTVQKRAGEMIAGTIG